MKHFILLLLIFLKLTIFAPSSALAQEDTTQVRTLLNRSTELARSDTDSALFYAQEAKKLAQKIEDKIGIAKAVYREGLTQMFRDNYFAADTNYQNALVLFKELNDIKGQAYTLGNRGLNYQNQAKYDKAVAVYLEALKINQAENDSIEIAKTYSNLGIVYKRIGNNERAIDYYQKAKTIFEAKKEIRFVGFVLNNIGLIYRDEENFDKAISTFREGLKITQSNNDQTITGGLYNSIATVYKQTNQFDSALINYQKAKEIFVQTNMTSKIAATNINLANLYIEKNELEKALKYGLEGFETMQKIQNSEYLQDANQTLATIYAKKNDFQKAFFYQKEYQTIRDSLFTEENKSELAKMEAKFGNRQKEFENELLKKDNLQKTFEIEQEKKFNQILIISIVLVSLLLSFVAILFYENQKKKTLLQTKNNAIQTLLSELHHRVKNNLQIIGSLLSIQVRRLEEPTAKHAIQDVQSRIRTMTLIHEKLYQTDLLTEVEIGQYVKELQEFLFRLYQKENQIEAIISIPKTYINVDKAIPLGLILNEWITNSLKYAFPDTAIEQTENNQITIELKENQSNYLFVYQDNGIGIQENKNIELPKNTAKKSMGTQLVMSLIEQLNAIKNEKAIQNGVKFELRIPL